MSPELVIKKFLNFVATRLPNDNIVIAILLIHRLNRQSLNEKSMHKSMSFTLEWYQTFVFFEGNQILVLDREVYICMHVYCCVAVFTVKQPNKTQQLWNYTTTKVWLDYIGRKHINLAFYNGLRKSKWHENTYLSNSCAIFLAPPEKLY